MTPRRTLILLALSCLGAGAVVLAQSRAHVDRHPSPPSPSGNVVVALCDGETTAEIPGVKEGETPTPAQARDVADRLMAAWREKNPTARWEEPVRLAAAEQVGGTVQGEAGGVPGGGAGGGAGGENPRGGPAGEHAALGGGGAQVGAERRAR